MQKSQVQKNAVAIGKMEAYIIDLKDDVKSFKKEVKDEFISLNTNMDKHMEKIEKMFEEREKVYNKRYMFEKDFKPYKLAITTALTATVGMIVKMAFDIIEKVYAK